VAVPELPSRPTYDGSVARLRLFAAARDVAGTARVELEGATVGDVLDAAVARFGPDLGAVIVVSRVWLNGEPATRTDPVVAADEVAVLPPVSGGQAPPAPGRPGAGAAG
jgi:molybdopterin synthase sulfur carrier subunit